MKQRGKRITAMIAALLMTVSLVQTEGSAVLKGVYFTAVNEQLLTLSSDTMPFWVGSKLYVCSTVFDGTDLELRYVHDQSLGLAMLYTSTTDLRFDLVNRSIYNKAGEVFEGSAIEKNGYVFFPLDVVCRYFDLKWTISSTDTVPLLRIRNDNAVLDDKSFVNAASTMMASRYAEYERMINNSQEDPGPGTDPDPGPGTDPEKDPGKDPEKTPDPGPGTDPEKDPNVDLPPVYAEEGQKIYLIFTGNSGESVREAMNILGGNGATFLMTAEQLTDGDLVREILGRGHSVALRTQGETAEEIRLELQRARELVWMAACSTLQLIWHDGSADLTALCEEQGCVEITASVDRRNAPLRSEADADALLRVVGRHKDDIGVYLGADEDCAEGLDALLNRLSAARYRLCAWRLTA